MPSYQIDACTKDANGNSVLVDSLEFEAPDTAHARIRADAWTTEKALAATTATVVRLYAGRALIAERVLDDSAGTTVWNDKPRS